MTAPRLEIRLDRIHDNARTLVERLGARGVRVEGVTKATLGSPQVADALLRAGVGSIGESRIENIEALRHAGVTARLALIRSPMISQADRVVASADVSYNTEVDVLDRLSLAARGQRRRHDVILMVELGDLREGILPGDLADVVAQALAFPAIVIRGIGTNLACQSGVVPDAANMAELSALAKGIETKFGIMMRVVSGGNSANLAWALDAASDLGRINHLRLGESILLGREPLHRTAIDGLHTDAVELVAEVIEVKTKPSVPRGSTGETAFGVQPAPTDVGDRRRVIVAIGRQDVDHGGLTAPEGLTILGASSDHLVLDAGTPGSATDDIEVGDEIRFDVDYAALVRAMTSPFVGRTFLQS